MLVVLPTGSITKLEEWRSDKFDLVHLNYGRRAPCEFYHLCVRANTPVTSTRNGNHLALTPRGAGGGA